jgi:hypothetical protein
MAVAVLDRQVNSVVDDVRKPMMQSKHFWHALNYVRITDWMAASGMT